MLTLGIFGDSYSDPIRHGHDNFRELDELGWPNLLKRKYDVGLHGKNSSSIFYSYQKFLEHHLKYDKIVFVVTDPLRWIKGYNMLGDEKHFNNYWTADSYLKSNKEHLSLEQVDLIEAIKSYYLHMVDDISCQLLANLMINHIKEIRPDVILIPISRGLVIDAVGFWDYINLFNKMLGVSQFNTETHYEYRLACHLSKEMNELVAKHVDQALEIGAWNPVLPNFVKHEFTNKDYYYQHSSTRGTWGK
jgi:hypothetical protein